MRKSDALNKVLEFCKKELTGEPLDYLLEDRKLNTELIEEFELGYYPTGAGLPIDFEWMKYHRLICYDDNKQTRCPFEGRIVIPIYDTYGELVSLQARIFEKDPTLSRYNSRKYYHSTFDKSRIIYNLHRVIPTVRRTGKIIVTEGQFDVITAHKFNIHNCVCTSGTVLNRHHMMVLSRYATDVLVLYDGDSAGKEAIEKMQRREYAGVKIRFVILPSDKEKIDLDSFLHDYGRKALVKLVKKTDGLDSLISSLSKPSK